MTSTSRRIASLLTKTVPAGDTAPAEGSAAADRWRFKPEAAGATGFVDGGWWPRSDDLATELPALLAAVAPRLGPVERVSYRIDDWAPVARRMTVDGVEVRLGGFRSQPKNTVDLMSRTQRLSVLVVPPSAEPHAAEQALAMAADSENVDDIAALLDGSSQPVGHG